MQGAAESSGALWWLCDCAWPPGIKYIREGAGRKGVTTYFWSSQPTSHIFFQNCFLHQLFHKDPTHFTGTDEGEEWEYSSPITNRLSDCLSGRQVVVRAGNPSLIHLSGARLGEKKVCRWLRRKFLARPPPHFFFQNCFHKGPPGGQSGGHSSTHFRIHTCPQRNYARAAGEFCPRRG